MSYEEDNRWSAFSDEEVKLIGSAMSALDREEDLIGFANEFSTEVEREHDRREEVRKAQTYRGPGYYTDVASRTTLHVVGQVRIHGELCLLIGSSMEDPQLWALPAQRIEGRDDDGRQRYEYSTVQP